MIEPYPSYNIPGHLTPTFVEKDSIVVEKQALNALIVVTTFSLIVALIIVINHHKSVYDET